MDRCAAARALARRAAVLLFVFLWGLGVAAASSVPAPVVDPVLPKDFSTYKPTAVAVPIAAADAPEIDGDLSDPVWARARPIDRFYQVQPIDGAPAGQRTRAFIVYDERNLYVAIYSYDDEPAKIRRALMERDAPIEDDDGVRIILDPLGTRRDGYFFATNPNGMRLDALVENNQNFREEWDTVWNVAASVVEDGWVAEFQIPFQSIAFDGSLEAWNFQIVRVVRRTNEEIRWSNIDQTRRRTDLTNPGRLVGVKGAKTGRGFEAQMFLAGSGAYDWEADDTSTDLRPSGNLFYKVTPALTGSLTFQPDFSDAPLDVRQVNTGRFSLFFPETRDFFLQDAAVFEFGGRNFNASENGLPFFTRNIGIVDGQPVNIIGGAKLSGKAGLANVGLITARTESFGDVEGQTLSAGRISVPFLQESKAGFVFTHGDPAGEASNTVLGGDIQFRNSTRWPGQLYVDALYQRSFDRLRDNALSLSDPGRLQPSPGDGGAIGDSPVVSDGMASIEAAYRSQKWNWTLTAQDIGENYLPRLGFLNREGVRRYRANGYKRYRPQRSVVREWEIGAFLSMFTDLDDEVLDRFLGVWAQAETNAGDRLYMETTSNFLDIREPFDIAGVVRVDVDKYDYVEHSVQLSLTEARPFAVSFEYVWGNIYDGQFDEVNVGYSIRPSRHFSIGGDYSYTAFDLPNGAIAVHVGAVESTIAFSPWMTLKTDIQYDNISENMTLFSRFRWEPRPEREIFLSFAHGAQVERTRVPGSFRSEGSALSLRLGHIFRF